MKRFIVIMVLIAALTTLLAGMALAAGPLTTSAQGFGPGRGIHAPGAGGSTETSTSSVESLAEVLPTGGAGVGGMMGAGAPAWAGQPEEAAALLDMTTAQIQAERLAGKSLAQIAAGQAIGKETLVATILAAKRADLASLVAEGKLTQAQADAISAHMETQVVTMVERTSVGPLANRGQGRSGVGGFRGGRNANR